MAKSVSYAVLSRETNIIQRAFTEGDTAYDADFAMFYILYHIFKQEGVQRIHNFKIFKKIFFFFLNFKFPKKFQNVS
jgi:hypothetical protein